MSYLKVINHTSGTSHHSEEEYGDWSEHTDNNIVGIALSHEDGYRDLVSSFEILPEVDYYLLYGIYSTGNSFGYSDGNIEYIHLFKTLEEAKEAERLVKEYSDNIDSEGYGTQLMIPMDGIYYPFTAPWGGYFEHLTYLSIEKVRIVDDE